MNTPLVQPLPLDLFDEIRKRVEEERRKMFSAILNWFIAALVIAIILFIWAKISYSTISVFEGIFLIVFVFSIPCLMAWQENKSYKKLYKSLIVSQFIEHFDATDDVQLTYAPLNGIEQTEFVSCGLFSRVTHYNSSGLIRGKIGSTVFECGQVRAEEIREVQTSKGTRKEKVLVFNGMFLIADFNKNFKGTTLVVPDYVEGALGNLGRSLQKTFARSGYNGLKIAYMEDPAFERAFAVYTSDQIEARYLLTPFVIQRIVELKRLCDNELRLAFRDGKIYIARSTFEHWMAPPSVGQPVTSKVLQDTQEQLLLPLQIIDRFGLNTRIWGKQ